MVSEPLAWQLFWLPYSIVYSGNNACNTFASPLRLDSPPSWIPGGGVARRRSPAVAGYAGRNQVGDVVIVFHAINMICLQARVSTPIQEFSAPVAGVWARANRVVKNHSVLGNLPSVICNKRVILHPREIFVSLDVTEAPSFLRAVHSSSGFGNKPTMLFVVPFCHRTARLLGSLLFVPRSRYALSVASPVLIGVGSVLIARTSITTRPDPAGNHFRSVRPMLFAQTIL